MPKRGTGGGAFADVPVDARRLPLLDDRRSGGQLMRAGPRVGCDRSYGVWRRLLFAGPDPSRLSRSAPCGTLTIRVTWSHLMATCLSDQDLGGLRIQLCYA